MSLSCFKPETLLVRTLQIQVIIATLLLSPVCGWAQDATTTFDSELLLEVWARRSNNGRSVRLGATPSADGKGIRLAKGTRWFVSPRVTTPVNKLVAECRKRGIPGLRLGWRRKFKDKEIRQLTTIEHLRYLEVWGGARIKDDTLQALLNMSKLSFLSLNCEGSLAAASPKVSAPIQHLDLRRTTISQSLLLSLSRVPSLRYLDLTGCKGVNRSGLRHLKKSKSLSVLVLASLPKLDAAAVRELVGVKGLVELSLEGTPLHEDAVAHLKTMQSLRLLCLDRCLPNLTPSEFDSLKKALPKCKIKR